MTAHMTGTLYVLFKVLAGLTIQLSTEREREREIERERERERDNTYKHTSNNNDHTTMEAHKIISKLHSLI